MLQERDQRGGDRHHLARGGDVHVLHVLRGGDGVHITLPLADQHAVLGEGAVLVQRGVRLRHHVAVLLVGGQVVDLIGDPAVETLRYGGVSMNPNAFTRAKDASDPIRPMFGPSGVSIGHIRP